MRSVSASPSPGLIRSDGEEGLTTNADPGKAAQRI